MLKIVVCYTLLFLVQTSLLQLLFVLYGLLLVISVMEILAPVRSIITLGIVFIFVMIFQNINRKHFGGISGDLMGFFICVVEFICFFIMGIGDFIC